MVKLTETNMRAQSLLAGAADALELLESAGIPPEDALAIARARSSARGIPVSVFNPCLGTLESMVKYLREELLLSYDAIAALLNRNPGPIGVTYRNALMKNDSRLRVTAGETIPFSVFSDKRLSVLEAVATHLQSRGHDWHEIARMLCRNDKTIWTVLDRARRKGVKTR